VTGDLPASLAKPVLALIAWLPRI